MPKQRVFDHIRDRLLEPVRAAENAATQPSLEEIRDSQWIPEFEELMRNRLVMGRFRYGGDLETGKGMDGYAYAESAMKRLQAYMETGNTEHLADIANCCMLEYEWPSHPEAHFKAQDDGPIHVERAA